MVIESNTMNAKLTKLRIIQALERFKEAPLKEASIGLFETLGYSSDKTFDLEPNNLEGFIDYHAPARALLTQKAQKKNSCRPMEIY